MRHWLKLGEAMIPGTKQMISLFQGKDDFFIKLSGGQELMSTRKHGSEDALGSIPCKKAGRTRAARVLVGGMGMGFTLAAALDSVGSDAEVTVAELIPEVLEWNRGPLGERSGRPLDDPRTRIYLGDVADLLRESPGYFDVIALDVDNGPEGLTVDSNNWLYSTAGIVAAQNALKSEGILAYWSAGPDQAFHDRLRQSGFLIEEVRVRAHGKRGALHTIWLATIDGILV
jgi:spermidine synthase